MSLGSTALLQGAKEHSLHDYFGLPFFSFVFSEQIVHDISNMEYEWPPSAIANRNPIETLLKQKINLFWGFF